MATASRAARSVQPSAAAAAASKKNSRQATAAAAKSRAATQAASRAGGKTAATRAGTTKPHPANAGRSKPPSKAGSKAPTRQGATRASQRKPTGGEPVLAVVGADGKIVVDGAAAEGEEKEQDEYDDDEYYDEDEEYDEDGEYDDDGEEGDEEGGREYFEEPEEEEEEFDYSTFQYRPHGYKQRDPDEPRALIDTGPEGCSCFPSRSNRNIPSMLYDNIDCKHEKLQGYAHLGIYRFDDNWDSSHESTLRPKLAHRLMPNKNFVWGYPKFVFVEADEPDKGPAPADDVTKELYEFEITPDFGRRIDRWHVKKKKLDLGGRRGLSRGSVGAGVGGGGEAPATERGTPASGGGGSRAPSRYSQPNQSSRLLEKRTVTRW